MKLRILLGLLLAVGGFLVIYLSVVLSFVAPYRQYVFPIVFLGIMLIILGVWVINPLGIWSKE